MTLLLDTNIVIPLIGRQLSELPAQVARLLEEHAPDCVCSAASLWEIAIKYRQGRLPLESREEELPEICASIGLPVLPITPVQAVTPVEPWPETKDPFDRILLAICEVEGFALVTTDDKLKQHRLAWKP